MRTSSFLLAFVLALALLVAPAAYAANPCATNPCATKDDPWAMHHQMKKEHLGMLKDLMVIVRDLNHKPTEAEKTKIDGMIKRLDDMIEQCDKWKGKRMKKGTGKGMKGM